MTIVGFIVRPDDTIIGATTQEGFDILFAQDDCVHRSSLANHSQRLLGTYLGTNTLCDTLKGKVSDEHGTTPV